MEVGSNLASGTQPPADEWHRNDMPTRACVFAMLFLVLAACTNQSPDQIRQKTAEETAKIKRDSKAVAQGVKEGLSNKRTIDLNHSSKDDLASLPGITAHQADRIVAERPYANTHQLVSRRILSEDEYARIQDRVAVNK